MKRLEPLMAMVSSLLFLLTSCGLTKKDNTTQTPAAAVCENVGAATVADLPVLWTQLDPAFTDGLLAASVLREDHTAVYDEANDRMIVFGGKGQDGTARNDVLVLSNASGAAGTPDWTQLSPAGTLPEARSSHIAAYDATNNRMIVLGGTNSANSIIALTDVWVLSSANGLGGTPAWTRFTAGGTAPSVRTRASGVYDTANNVLILFGGVSCSQTACTPFNEVYTLSNANGSAPPAWSRLTPSDTGPSARFRHSAAYDQTTNRMIIFGGDTSTAFTADPADRKSDTWVLSAANGLGVVPSWSQLGVSGAPAARSGHTTVYDETSNRLILFAGAGTNRVVRREVWVLSSANGAAGSPAWTEYATGAPQPPSRASHTAVYSPSRNRMVIFGGDTGNSNLVGDAWVLRNANGVSPVPVGSITIHSRTTTLCAGNTMQLIAVARDSAEIAIEGIITITWTTSNTAVADIDDTGLITGGATGAAELTACSGGVCSAPLTVTITAPAGTPGSGTGTGFTGTWRGTATQTDAACDYSGTMTMSLTQSGSSLTGTISLNLNLVLEKISGFCTPTRTDSPTGLAGSVNGSNFTFSVTGTTFTGAGTLSGNTLSGTTTVTSAGVTTQGTFQLTRQ